MEKEMEPTPVFLPGESQGRGSLVADLAAAVAADSLFSKSTSSLGFPACLLGASSRILPLTKGPGLSKAAFTFPTSLYLSAGCFSKNLLDCVVTVHSGKAG